MHYNLIVIGGGPGGYTAAIRASELGAKVALVEEKKLGGTCLNRGCIPTKVYTHASSVIYDMEKAQEFGISSQHQLDINKLRKQKEKTVNTLVNGVGYLMKAHGIEVINEKAKFIDEHTIEAGERITADKFIIATGSKTFVPKIEGIELHGVMTSDEALELKSIPESIVIIGSGVIGLEFAYIYNSFGSKVTIIEMLPELLPMLDRDVAKVVSNDLKKKGINLFLNSKVEKIEKYDKGMKVFFKNIDTECKIECSKVLVSVGRTANINGLEALDIVMHSSGIQVDSTMKTSIDHIYAIGDVTGTIQLAHFASNQGIVAANNIMGNYMEQDANVVPSCVYTNPEIAWVGINESEARAKYEKVKVGIFQNEFSGRSLSMGESTGFIKIVTGGDYDQILGMQIVGKNASEIVHEGAIAIKNEFTIYEIINLIHAHPTLSEGIKEACEHISGFPINML